MRGGLTILHGSEKTNKSTRVERELFGCPTVGVESVLHRSEEGLEVGSGLLLSELGSCWSGDR